MSFSILKKCEWCGREEEGLVTHHLIPRWLEGLNGETMEVCPNCHQTLESRFFNFVKYDQFAYLREYNRDYERKYVCWWRGKKVEKTACHHIIPRWLGGTKEDRIEVCQSCHVKLESRFNNFIKYGAFLPVRWENPDKRREYFEEYHRQLEWKEYMSSYYLKNREKIREQQKSYREANRDKLRAYARRYYHSKGKKHREKNSEKIKEYKRRYRIKHREEIREYERQYRYRHRDKINRQRRARRVLLKTQL